MCFDELWQRVGSFLPLFRVGIVDGSTEPIDASRCAKVCICGSDDATLAPGASRKRVRDPPSDG